MESISSWATVFDIAGRRHGTKQGNQHLSEHAYAVLEAFVEKDTQERLLASMGYAISGPSV